jgi:hypothetical protein
LINKNLGILMIKEIIRLANSLDRKGLTKEADLLDQILFKMAKKENDCPKATQDLDLNLKNRQKAIDKYLYGPMNPALDKASGKENNDTFWEKIAKVWSGKSKVKVTLDQAKTMRCSNCAAFDTSAKIKNCIEKGMDGKDKGKDSWDTIKAGKLGYCNFLDFKCAAQRTCKAWVVKE